MFNHIFVGFCNIRPNNSDISKLNTTSTTTLNTDKWRNSLGGQYITSETLPPNLILKAELKRESFQADDVCWMESVMAVDFSISTVLFWRLKDEAKLGHTCYFKCRLIHRNILRFIGQNYYPTVILGSNSAFRTVRIPRTLGCPH